MKRLAKRNNSMANTLEAFSLRSCWCYCNACDCGCDCSKTKPSTTEKSKGQSNGKTQGGTSVQSQNA